MSQANKSQLVMIIANRDGCSASRRLYIEFKVNGSWKGIDLTTNNLWGLPPFGQDAFWRRLSNIPGVVTKEMIADVFIRVNGAWVLNVAALVC